MVQNLKGNGLCTVFELCQIWLQLIKKVVFLVHDMNAYWGSWGATPDICNLSTSWRRVISFYMHFTPRETPPAPPPPPPPEYPLNRGWCEHDCLDALYKVNENIKVKVLLSIKSTLWRHREWHGGINLQTFSTLATLENELWSYFLCFTF